MKQILQSLKNGITDVVEVPVPSVGRGQVLIQTSKTLVSAGTERMLVEFGKAGWIDKARQQPDKVRMVLDKIKSDGLQPTIEAVFNKLNQPLPLGYCNVGRVVEVGSGVTSYSVGDRVISNGKHAEVVSVPINLCAKIPESVADEEAAFTVLGAIALQGIRLAKPTLGETVVVTGLGLVGMMAAQLLKAHGCRVLGIDFDEEKLSLARQFGVETVGLAAGQDPVEAARVFSRGRGVDAVLVTAATKSSEPIHQAAQMCRQRGRIVLVGVTGLELSRADFYEKELSFQVSCSYGPGRYDPNYEEKGQDYPIGFVRWTEQRNFEAVLDLMNEGRLNLKTLISHRYAIEEAEKAYELIGSEMSSLGVLLEYPGIEITADTRTVCLEETSIRSSLVGTKTSVSFVGAGNYATSTLIPAFKAAGVHLRSVASNSGVSGVHAGQKFGFDETTTDTDRIFEDTESDAVVITTRHDTHAGFVLKALKAGKHVFVEKPFCLTSGELKELKEAYFFEAGVKNSPIVMVGFNRRFAPHVQKMKQLLRTVSGPKTFVMTVNAGSISEDHWTQDLKVGGGRIIGEACHFIDLIRYLADEPITSTQRMDMDAPTRDTVTVQLQFGDGSIGTVHYFSNGNKAVPKERLEVFVAGRVLQMNNYRKLNGFGWPDFNKMSLWRQDKGQIDCVRAFVEAIQGKRPAPIPFAEIVEVSRISLELAGA